MPGRTAWVGNGLQQKASVWRGALESGADGGKGSHIAPSTRVAAGEAQQGGLWRHREVLREKQGNK